MSDFNIPEKYVKCKYCTYLWGEYYCTKHEKEVDFLKDSCKAFDLNTQDTPLEAIITDIIENKDYLGEWL